MQRALSWESGRWSVFLFRSPWERRETTISSLQMRIWRHQNNPWLGQGDGTRQWWPDRAQIPGTCAQSLSTPQWTSSVSTVKSKAISASTSHLRKWGSPSREISQPKNTKVATSGSRSNHSFCLFRWDKMAAPQLHRGAPVRCWPGNLASCLKKMGPNPSFNYYFTTNFPVKSFIFAKAIQPWAHSSCLWIWSF